MSVFTAIPDSVSRNWGIPYPELGLERRELIRVELHRRPDWFPVVESRLINLLMLGPDWDARGSQPVSWEDVRDTLVFLAAVMRDDTLPPWIGPLGSGGIQLAWKVEDLEVEAVFDRARDERELLVSVGDNEWEAPVDAAESLFATVVDRLAAGDPIPA